MQCRIVKIPKGNGRWRTIYVPDDELKGECRRALPLLAAKARELDIHNVQHGFTASRSPVTNALKHVGWTFTLSFDLEDFFQSVGPKHVYGKLPQIVVFISSAYSKLRAGEISAVDLFVDASAQQGLPSSPALANIAASSMDNDIMKLQRKGRFKSFEYTRYADDMCFSCDQIDVVKMLRREIPPLVKKHGFKLNDAKTKLQWAGAGRRNITGVAVDHTIHPTREIKRRLRAARHQLQHGIKARNLRKLIARQKEMKRKGRDVSLGDLLVSQYRGLKEWSRLRRPKPSASIHSTNTTTPISTEMRVTPTNTGVAILAKPYSRKFA